jgi:hypothetical protein
MNRNSRFSFTGNADSSAQQIPTFAQLTHLNMLAAFMNRDILEGNVEIGVRAECTREIVRRSYR